MTNKMLKLTPIALSVFAAFQVNAALYQVVKVGTPDDIANAYTANITVGSAIQESDLNTSSDMADSCFNSAPSVMANGSTTACGEFLLAGETRLADTSETTGTLAGQPIDGVSFREEAPFGMDNAFSYVQTETDFQNYCELELKYSICSSWAATMWGPWADEINGSTAPNAIAFLENSSSYDYDHNTVINQVTSEGDLVGIRSSLGDTRAAVDAISPISLPGSYDKSRAWKSDGTYTVGSVSADYVNDYGDHYTSHAAIWNASDLVQLTWQSGTANTSSKLAQGSMRDFVVVDNVIYGVGYNSWDSSNNYMNATVFTADVSSSDIATATWIQKSVQNAQVKISGTYEYSNTVLTGINKNLVAIGEAKRAGSVPADGAAANRPFLIDDASASTLNATFFANQISFTEAGGKATAINDYNEIVGQIDIAADETVREVSGKPRRKRGFIYPYSGTGSSDARRAIFGDQAWLLDDLTNGGGYSSANNAYRIISANDINDAGVIAATAVYCEGGYDSTENDATCGNGSGVETTVAVKLVPIAGATSSDISTRGYTSSTAARKGASLGYGALSLLVLVLFGRRRRIL